MVRLSRDGRKKNTSWSVVLEGQDWSRINGIEKQRLVQALNVSSQSEEKC